MTFTQLILTFQNRDWLSPVSDFFMGAGALSVEIRENQPVLTVLATDESHAQNLYDRFAGFADLMDMELPAIQQGTVKDTDWVAAFRAHFAPFQMCPSFKVVPEWEAGEADRHDPGTLVVDPGQAFGTGLHPTTALAAEFLIDATNGMRPFTMMDVGCGSGILSVAGLKNGASRILAFDVDPLCSPAVLRHVHLNGVSPDRILTCIGTHQMLKLRQPVDVVVINIIETVIRSILPDIRDLVGRTLILSGVLQSDAPAFVSWLQDTGFDVRNQAVREEWAAFHCEPV